jgi:hypothetical protein
MKIAEPNTANLKIFWFYVMYVTYHLKSVGGPAIVGYK